MANCKGCRSKSENGRCLSLKDVNFGEKDYPFYQTAEEYEAADLAARRRLIQTGQGYLIEKYRM